MAYRYGLPNAIGTLTLTDERLIWTPIPFPWSLLKLTIERTDVTDALAHRYSWWLANMFFRWSADIRVDRKSRKFVFVGVLPGGAESRTRKWVKAIREWANLSG
jgi:hypothetical protein